MRAIHFANFKDSLLKFIDLTTTVLLIFFIFFSLQNLILGFRMNELQVLLTFANCKRPGNKKVDLQKCALQLLTNKVDTVREKIKEIYENA
jgi:hypothetical protein